MAIFGRLKGPKKSTIEEKKRDALLPVAKPEQPKYVHVPVHAAADSLNVIALPVKSNMRQQVREQKIGSNKFIAPRLKSSQTWSPGDLSITSVLEQPLEIGQVRKSTRHSSFNSSNRRPPFKSSTSLARSRSLLANTIVGTFSRNPLIRHF
jgi:hypothetical protein